MAVAGEDSPCETWAAVSASGKVGKLWSPVKAAQPRPIAVAKPNGIPYLQAKHRS